MLPAVARRLARPRLMFECLEERAVPAYDLAIDGDTLDNVAIATDIVTIPGTTIVRPTASGAVLAKAELETYLATTNVLITTGPAVGSAEDGDINWIYDSVEDDFAYFGTPRTLAFSPDSSANVGNVNIDGVTLSFSDNIDFVINTTSTAVAGDINLLNGASITGARSLLLNAGGGTVTYDLASFGPITESGNVQINAGLFQSTFGGVDVSSNLGNVTINAPMDVSSGLFNVRSEEGTVLFTRPVNGGGDLTVYGKEVTFAASVGAVLTLSSLTLAGGKVTAASIIAPNTIDALTVNVGDDNFLEQYEATLGASGTITGDVNVNSDGNVAPGGAGVVGTLAIDGTLNFNGGDYALDLGATPDLITVTGDLNITNGFLGDETSTGAMTAAGDFKIIDFDGSFSGEFNNAALNTNLLVGFDAIRVTNYGPTDTDDVTIARVAANPTPMATGNDFDGTGYTLKLTGGGELVTFKNGIGQLEVIARNTTKKSKLILTTKVNASDDLIDLGLIAINGDIAAVNLAKGNVATGIRSRATTTTSGAIGSVSVHDMFGDFTSPAAIASIAVGGNFFGAIRAASVGKIKVGRTLGNGFSTWNVTNGITSITAPQIFDVTINAKFIGSITVNGDLKQHIAGNVDRLVLNLSGNDATAKTYGLKRFTAKGTVTNSLFDVRGGSVGMVTVGRFIDSNLYVGYTPGAFFEDPGTFVADFKLEKFSTTAKWLNDANNLWDYAFSNSQLVADNIGTVKLTGLNTSSFLGTFGIKFKTAGGSVKVTASDSVDIPLNTNLTPTTNVVPLANQFFYLDVL